ADYIQSTSTKPGVGIHQSYWIAVICFAYLAFYAYAVKGILKKQGIDFDKELAASGHRCVMQSTKQKTSKSTPKSGGANFQPLAVGIDIGGTGTKFGIVDRNGNILYSSEISTKGHQQVESFIDALYDSLKILIDQAGGPGRMKGIGVGAPNGNFYTGTIEYAPNLPWKGIIPLAKLIENKFHLPVALTNDANAAAIGEMMYGAAKEIKDFIMITLA